MFHYDTKTTEYLKIYEIDVKNKKIIDNSLILESRVTFSFLNDNSLYLGTSKGDLIIFNLHNNQSKTMKACHNSYITAIDITNEGNIITSGSDKFINIWNNNIKIKELKHENYITCLKYSKKNKILIATSLQVFYIYDLSKIHEVREPKAFSNKVNHKFFITSVLYIRKIGLVVTGDNIGQICLWKISVENDQYTISFLSEIKRSNYITQIIYLKEYKSILLNVRFSKIELLRLDDELKIIKEKVNPNFQFGDEGCSKILYSRDIKKFISGTPEKKIIFWGCN